MRRLSARLVRVAAAAILPLAAAALAACSNPVAPDAAPSPRDAVAQSATTSGPIIPWF